MYDGLQQDKGLEFEEQDEGAGLLYQGAELLVDTSCNYQYYMIDGSGIKRITLFWVMKISRFLQDSNISCKLIDLLWKVAKSLFCKGNTILQHV